MIIFKSLVLPLFIFIAVWVLPVEHVVHGSHTEVEDVTLDLATKQFTTPCSSSFVYLASRSAWVFYTTLSMWNTKEESLSLNGILFEENSRSRPMKINTDAIDTPTEVSEQMPSSRPFEVPNRCHRHTHLMRRELLWWFILCI